jgi:hypothetical protein
MSLNLRYPNITGASEKEQLTQIRSYLHQLVEQLNYALPTIGTVDGESKQQSATPSTIEVQGSNMSYYELRSLIIHDLQQLDTKFQQLSQKVYSDLQEAKDKGEFDGEDGYTPVKGVDYFTETEVNSMAKQAAEKIAFTLDDDGNLYYEVEE